MKEISKANGITETSDSFATCLVTSYDPATRDVLKSDTYRSLEDITPLPDGRVPGRCTDLYVTDKPKPNDRGPDPSDTDDTSECLVAPGSVKFRVTEIAPKTKTEMMNTRSVDFGVVFSGNVVQHLENGEKTKLSPGDTFVQKGTMHAWENESEDLWVRMYVVLLEADKDKST